MRSCRIAAVDEGVVENILDIVEGETASAEAEPLDADRDQVAYDVEELEDEQLDALADALRAADIAFAWGDEELYVYADDEAAVDELFEQVAVPRRARRRGRRDPGRAGRSRPARRRVRRRRSAAATTPRTATGAPRCSTSALTIDDLEAPYGMGGRDWEAVCAGVGRLADELTADELDEDKVQETARELRACSARSCDRPSERVGRPGAVAGPKAGCDQCGRSQPAVSRLRPW